MSPYYEDDAVTLYHGDALEVFPEVADGSLTAVILDPPYSMTPNSVRGRDDGAAGTSGSPMRLLNESAKHARRALRPGGVAAFLCDVRRHPDVSYLTTLTGMRVVTTVAWTRTRIGVGGMYRSAWDPILVTSNGSPEYKPGEAVPNVVMANPPSKRAHPYEKPPLIWSHILDRLPPGIVLDPFAGSGSSMVAAIEAGHRWIGVENHEPYCDLIVQRRTSADIFGAIA